MKEPSDGSEHLSRSIGPVYGTNVNWMSLGLEAGMGTDTLRKGSKVIDTLPQPG